MENRFNRPVFQYLIIFFLVLLAIVSSLYMANFAASWLTPPWPIIGLHGVKPDMGIQAWGRILDLQGGQGFNSWGQRDRQREWQPAPGVRRIGFVGDSFLEESVPIPLPLVVEKKIGRDDVEVVNFGVSATGTSDYFYRIKNVVIPLGTKEIFLFFYVGNDFPPDKLSTRLGIFSTYPKDSIAARMGLLALNHVLTNRHRNVLRVWKPDADESLHVQEQAMMRRLQTMSDTEIRDFLLDLSHFSGEKRDRLQRILARPESRSLFATLRHPDGGLFRSYMLQPLFHWAVGDTFREENSSAEALVEGIYPRILAMKQVCDSAGVAFTLILVPMGFQVDPRYVETWSLFGDFSRFGVNRLQATRLFKERLLRDGIAVHDLAPLLMGIRGTYLNVDGHWSQMGVDRVADEMISNGILAGAIRNPDSHSTSSEAMVRLKNSRSGRWR
ncbi:MAG: hypothetical protein HW380_1777 [Magnetococcales bacterium]|nr:hypothetical protein [Magnetococcales bacterium]HIJ84644.1 hypothetical protein [Magnetococcales bacterium]